jgi:hypothetical protein
MVITQLPFGPLSRFNWEKGGGFIIKSIPKINLSQFL